MVNKISPDLTLTDGLHIVAILLIVCASIVGDLPFWLRIYTPVFMPYHYYPAAMAVGLYTCHRYHQTIISASIITILGCFISFIWWCLWINEYNLAGMQVVQGERNYSHVIGSNQSLRVDTSQFDNGSEFYLSMSTLDVTMLCFLMLMSLALAVNVMIHLYNQYHNKHSVKSKCCRTPFDKMCKKQTRELNSEKTREGFRGRGFMLTVSAFGIGIFVYYLVISVIMLTQSVMLINPVASPNTMFIYVSFATVGIPDIKKTDKKWIMVFIYSLIFFWLWSLAISITAISQLAIWRMVQTPYISTTSGICPGNAINQTLTYNAEYEWGNFSFPGFPGIDKMTLHNNTLNWSPELFATYSCADDSLMLAQIGLSALGFFAMVQYINQPRSTQQSQYGQGSMQL